MKTLGTYLPLSPQRTQRASVGVGFEFSGLRSLAYSHQTTHTSYLHAVSALFAISAVNKHKINICRN